MPVFLFCSGEDILLALFYMPLISSKPSFRLFIFLSQALILYHRKEKFWRSLFLESDRMEQ